MRFKTTTIDSLLGRARRAQYRYEAQASQLHGLLELALDAEASGRPVPNPVIRQLEAIVEAGEKHFDRSGLLLKKWPAKRRKRVKPRR